MKQDVHTSREVTKLKLLLKRIGNIPFALTDWLASKSYQKRSINASMYKVFQVGVEPILDVSSPLPTGPSSPLAEPSIKKKVTFGPVEFIEDKPQSSNHKLLSQKAIDNTAIAIKQIENRQNNWRMNFFNSVNITDENSMMHGSCNGDYQLMNCKKR